MSTIVFLTGSLSLDGESYPVTNLDIAEATSLIDVSDLNDDNLIGENKSFTSDGGKQYTFSCDLWHYTEREAPVTDVEYDAIITIDTETYTGKARLSSVNKNGAIDAIIRLSISGNFSGKVDFSA